MSFLKSNFRWLVISAVLLFVWGIYQFWGSEPQRATTTENTRVSKVSVQRNAEMRPQAAAVPVIVPTNTTPSLDNLLAPDLTITDEASSQMGMTSHQLATGNAWLLKLKARVEEIRRKSVVAMAQGNQSELYRIPAFRQEADGLRQETITELRTALGTEPGELFCKLLQADKHFADIGAYEMRLNFRTDPSHADRKICSLEEIEPSNGDRVKRSQMPLAEVNQMLGLQFGIDN